MPSGVLLYGPPGTGKTMLARAAAAEAQVQLVQVRASDLIRATFGTSEKILHTLFRLARRVAPCLLFLDEFQAMFAARGTGGHATGGVSGQLLQLMDDNNAAGDHRVVVLAATNAPEAVDAAFLRPGRFDRVLLAGPLAHDERKRLFETHLAKWIGDRPPDPEKLARATQGFTGADVAALCRAAVFVALRHMGPEELDPTGMPKLTQAHFDAALRSSGSPSVGRTLRAYYMEWKPGVTL